MSDLSGACDLVIMTILLGLFHAVGTDTGQFEDQKLSVEESAKR